MADSTAVMGQDGYRTQPDDGGTMSDDQDHPRPVGDAGTERAVDELQALRADVAALLGRFDSLQRSLVGDGQHSLIEQLQDNLADVASGDVVSALWDEVRIVRTELAEGLVVEPSDALSASLDALRAEVDGLRESLGELRDAPAPVPAEGGRDDDAVLQRLGTIEASIDGLRGRLDEGLVLADDTEPAAAGGADVEAVADQVAALRDFVASELDTVRQTVSARIDAATEATVAAASARPEPEAAPMAAAVSATIDPDTVELLREEIRAAGTVSDQVIDALRDELKALRRRIAVKATERVLDDQQLAQIADAVAARLADTRDQA
jgi:hypothetical protein